MLFYTELYKLLIVAAGMSLTKYGEYDKKHLCSMFSMVVLGLVISLLLFDICRTRGFSFLYLIAWFLSFMIKWVCLKIISSLFLI